jgi:hypothetical protein
MHDLSKLAAQVRGARAFLVGHNPIWQTGLAFVV